MTHWQLLHLMFIICHLFMVFASSLGEILQYIRRVKLKNTSKVKNIQSYHITKRKAGSRVVIWGCFSSLTALTLISTKGTINSFEYQAILEQFFRLLLKNL